MTTEVAQIRFTLYQSTEFTILIFILIINITIIILGQGKIYPRTASEISRTISAYIIFLGHPYLLVIHIFRRFSNTMNAMFVAFLPNSLTE